MGTITITSPGSVYGGYTYSFDNGVTFGTAISRSFAPGSYGVIARADNSRCVSVATSAVVNAGPGPAAPVLDVTQPTCTSAKATIAIKYPVKHYQYSFDNGATFGTATSVTVFNSGKYQVIARDQSGCISLKSLAVVNGQPPTPDVGTIIVTQPDCSNPTGGISIDPNSVNGSYLYSFDNGSWAPNTSANGLAAGSHTVSAMNASGCISLPVGGVVTAAPATASAPTLSVTQPSCVTPTGTITVTSPILGYQYSFDFGKTFAATTSQSGLAAGGYDVIARNTSGCTSTPSLGFILLNAPPSTPSAPAFSVTQPNCAAPTGTINITSPVSGFQYSFDNGTTFGAATSQSGLTAGSYNVIAQNTSGCNSVASSTVVNAPGSSTPSTPTLTITQPTCNTLTGTITITAPVSGYLYSFDNGTTFGTATSVNGLTPGSYNVIAQNTSGCNSLFSSAVVNESPIPLAPTTNVTQPTCTSSTGTITITSPVSGYLYSFDDGLTFGPATTNNGLASGNYHVITQNTSGCNSSASLVEVDAAPAPVFVSAPLVNITNQSGCSAPSGAISITSRVAGFQYSFNNGATYDTLTTIGGLAAGTYQVIAKNAFGCMSTATSAMVATAITLPPSPSLSVTTQTSCAAPSGAISINSPVAGYQYSFDNGVTFSTASSSDGLDAGTYQVIAQNAYGCVSTATSVLVPASLVYPPSPSVSITSQTSCAAPTGEIAINSPVKGNQYSFDNGVTYDTLTIARGLAAGSYQVITKTPQGCTSATTMVMVNAAQIIPPSPTLNIISQTGCTIPTGGISVNLPVAGYQYSFNNGVYYDTTSTAVGLAEGTYTVVARTTQGCNSAPTMAVIVNASVVPTPPTVNVVNQSGCAWSTGSIAINSPVAGYQYSFDNGTTYDALTSAIGLAAGTYQVMALTPQGCNSAPTMVLVNDAKVFPPSPSVTVVAQTSCATPTGAIFVDSPVAGYQYSFDNGTTYDTLTNAKGLAAATYQVTAMTQVGCNSAPTMVLVNDAKVFPPPPAVTIAAQTSCATKIGSITISSPVTGYQYSFDNGSTYDTLTSAKGLDAGTYQVIAMTSLGCNSAPTTALVNDAKVFPLSPAVTIAAQTSCTTKIGSITINSPVTGYQYSFDNGTSYDTLTSAKGLAAGTYQVVTKTPLGCPSSATSALVNDAVVIPLSPLVSITQPDCASSTGAVSINTPVAGYQYSFNDGATYDTLTNIIGLASGTYQILAKSSLGCVSASAPATVHAAPSVPSQPTLTLDITNPTAPMLTSSLAEKYQWFANGEPVSNDTLQTLTVTAPGAYTVVVFSREGCPSQSSKAQLIVVAQIEGLPSSVLTPYPNPSSTTFYLDLPAEINSVQVFSSGGSKVDIDFRQEGSKYAFEVKHLSSGLYILNLNSQAKSYSIRFIKQ
jgi:hypothetical protein